MVKRIKRGMAILVIMALVLALLPGSVSHAATGTIRYYLPDNTCYTAERIGTALSACHKAGGGRIEILSDCQIQILPSNDYAQIGKNTEVCIAEGVTVTIGTYGIPCYGKISVYGTLDLQHSKGILAGDGTIETIGKEATVLRPSYEITTTDEDCFEPVNLRYGQTLGEIAVDEKEANWQSSQEGTWTFADGDYRPQPGTHTYDVLFVPQYPLMYEPKSFELAAKVTVDATTPRCDKYEQPSVHVGETLMQQQPKVSYVNPYSGEEAEGKFYFCSPQEIRRVVGEQTVLCRFQPEETDKYKEVEQYQKITVLPTVPEVITKPLIRNEVESGQMLCDVTFLNGVCRNPYSGEVIEGTWEWKDETQLLEAGENDYTMLFLPKENGYEVQEISITVVAKEKEPDIEPEEELGECEPEPEPDNRETKEETQITVSTMQATTGGSKGVFNDEPAYVITQLVSKMSTIKKTVSVKKVTIKKAKRSSKKIKLSWKKVAGAKYEVRYSTNKKMKRAKKKLVAKTKVTLSGLKKGKKYYVRVRAWKKSDGKKIYGKWSKKKKV